MSKKKKILIYLWIPCHYKGKSFGTGSIHRNHSINVTFIGIFGIVTINIIIVVFEWEFTCFSGSVETKAKPKESSSESNNSLVEFL